MKKPINNEIFWATEWHWSVAVIWDLWLFSYLFIRDTHSSTPTHDEMIGTLHVSQQSFRVSLSLHDVKISVQMTFKAVSLIFFCWILGISICLCLIDCRRTGKWYVSAWPREWLVSSRGSRRYLWKNYFSKRITGHFSFHADETAVFFSVKDSKWTRFHLEEREN